MVGLFVSALATSAALLFWVQPMIAKLLLPYLGGTPAVWNTCMVFFQATLLAGYSYAHFLTTRFSFRAQVLIHLAVLGAAAFALPVAVHGAALAAMPWQSNPWIWLFRALVVSVGAPFFVISSTAPLLQSWFGRTSHPAANDPYFLYAASNAGSLAGLLAYPVLIEPGFALATQTRLWGFGYGLLALFIASSGAMAWRARASGAASVGPASTAVRSPGADPTGTWTRRLRWLLAAFIPSGLMLAVTSFLATDIAGVPLLWVGPLSLYLLTFILAFSRRRIIPLDRVSRVLPGAAAALVFVMLMSADNLAWLQILIHLGFFFLAALVWHSRLAADRPARSRLTEFYFFLSLGGVLGGVFNALLAPLLFHSVVEYYWMIVLASLGWTAAGRERGGGMAEWRGWIVPATIFGGTTLLAVGVPRVGLAEQWCMLLAFGAPLILCYTRTRSRYRHQFALCLGAVLMASHFFPLYYGQTLHTERDFYGTLRITSNPKGRITRLYHGTTVHGMQFTAPERQGEPLAYYHRAGPCGQAMAALPAANGPSHIAVIGLGAGAMVCYAQPGQRWTFYEIDPAVIRIARDTRFFTYLRECTNAPVEFVEGDARLRLREAPEGSIQLLVCDAFGSDAPPLHLLNREAMELYLSRLAPNGVMLFHISSRYLDFRPVLGNLAAFFHLEARVNNEQDLVTQDSLPEGAFASTWVVLARRAEDLGSLRSNPRWLPLRPRPGMRLWTDDYSNILGIFEWE